MKTMKEMFVTYSNVSLRKIAIDLNVNYNMLLKASKKPIPNQIYDPNEMNFDEVEKYLNSKLGDEDGIFNYQSGIDWERLHEETVRTKKKKVFIENDLITLRGNADVYKVFWMSCTHIFLIPYKIENMENAKPRLFSIETFDHQTPKMWNEGVEIDLEDLGEKI